MKALIQRVAHSSVTVEGEVVGAINKGFLVLMGVEQEDTQDDLDYLIRKITKLRVFEDEQGKMNLSLEQVDGEVLLVSQFTLLADTRKGNRPSFNKAADPDTGKLYYEKAIQCFKEAGLSVATGSFGASMQVELLNNGPVTIWIDSQDRLKPRK